MADPVNPSASAPSLAERLVRPTAWAFYVLIVFEILFMICPFALHFYASYGPALDLLHRRPSTAWLSTFYLPHFTETASPALNAVHDTGFIVIVVGLLAFLAAAGPVYWAKLRRSGPSPAASIASSGIRSTWPSPSRAWARPSYGRASWC